MVVIAQVSGARAASSPENHARTERRHVPETQHQRLVFADAIRATAIFAVVLHHFVYLTGPSIGHQRPYVLGYLGVWGVNCFFVLSGYLLGRPYLASLVDPSVSFPSTRLFWSRRFLRIYPLYAVALVFSILCVAAQTGYFPGAGDITAHFLMLHTLNAEMANSINGPLWTMAVDAEFYLALPLFALLLARLLRGRTRRTRLFAVAGVLVAIAVASTGYRYFQLTEHPATVHNFAVAVVDVRNLFGFAATFAFGVGLALVTMLLGPNSRPRPLFYAVLIAAGVVIALSQLTVRVEEPLGRIGTNALLRLTFMEPLAALSVTLILFGLAEGAPPAVVNLARTRTVAAAAALAYAVYLLHFPIVEGVALLLHRPHGNFAFLLVSTVSLVFIMPIAYVANRFVERPFLRMKDALRAAQAAAPESGTGLLK